MGPGYNAVRSSGPSCLPGGSQGYLTRSLFPQRLAPSCLFSSEIRGIYLLSAGACGEGLEIQAQVGWLASQLLSMCKEDQTREIWPEQPDRCGSKPAGC